MCIDISIGLHGERVLRNWWSRRSVGIQGGLSGVAGREDISEVIG
jgi:hypothetical protein